MVVICTRNRPDDLARALALSQECSPGIAMLVADASDEPHDVTVKDVASHFPTCELLFCAPGLARQRNQALDWVRRERPDIQVVHFIDDDTEPLTGYFAAIESVFAREPDVGGVGGVVVGEKPPRFLLIKRAVGLSSPKAGVVLASGQSTMPYIEEWLPSTPQRLPGCAMSYRLSHIAQLAFDNRLEGYSYGEDVYFSFALSETHRLAVEPRARVRHRLSPANRHSRAQMARDGLPVRHRFVRENRQRGLRLTSFWWSVAADIVMRGVKGVVTADGTSLAVARGMVRGTLDILRHPLPTRSDAP
jgi:hypothetical protein